MKAFFASGLLIISSWVTVHSADFTREEAGKIAQIVGVVLEQAHYLQSTLDEERAEIFFENYLDALDANRMIFLESDIEEFRKEYLKDLPKSVFEGSTEPAFAIFDRYIKRLERWHNYIHEELLNKEFDFTKAESFIPDRDELPWPSDEAEAKDLWHDRVKNDFLQGRLAEEERDVVQERIRKRYDRLWDVMSQYEEEEILETYLTALARAYDPHSAYLSPTEAENFEINNIDLSLTGIGARLTWEDGYTKIVSLVPGGPAAESGELSPDDRIVSVAQAEEEPVEVVGTKLRDVVHMIRGPIGKKVRLEIIPAEAPSGTVRKEVTLVRDKIELKKKYAKAKVIEKEGADGETRRLGVIELPQFYKECAVDVRKLIERLKKENIEGLALDLRRNSGGILDQAVDVAGLFIKEGPIVQYQNYRQTTNVLKDDDGEVAYEGPLAVMAGKLSASASEIVAAALQDYDRAIVVGHESTHGKGTVQTVLSLQRPFKRYFPSAGIENPGRLKFTVSKFYRIAGATTQRQGVTPDIVLPSNYEALDLGEASLDNSLPADQIAPVDYSDMQRIDPFLEALRKRSNDRVSVSPEFKMIREDIGRIRKRRQKKEVSLNEVVRQKQEKEREAWVEQRKDVGGERPYKLYRLTIDMVDEGKDLESVSLGEASKKSDENENAGESTGEEAEEKEDSEGESGSTFELDRHQDQAVDPYLDETFHILWDYIELLKKKKPSFLAETSGSKGT